VFRPRRKRLKRAGEQVHILLGHLGIARTDPDYDALAVLDHILGCGPGFSDRLTRRLRDELGLAYSVGGGFCDTADLAAGVFRIYAGTSPAAAARVVAVIRDQIRAMHRGEFSNEEVERARNYLAGSWVFDYQTVAQRADRLLELERWGLPLEEPLNWPDRISRVSPRAVRQAAQRHLHPEALVQVEVGPIDAE
jgi:zinc protease